MEILFAIVDVMMWPNARLERSPSLMNLLLNVSNFRLKKDRCSEWLP